jgi:hypothetical protein
MSRRLILGLIAGLSAAALPICVHADGGDNNVTITTTGDMSAGPGQTKTVRSTITVNANGNATTQPAANDKAATTQPNAGAATQPAADAPTTRPGANAAAPAPPQNIVAGNNAITITTTGTMSSAPGQVRVIHSTITVTAIGGNVIIQPATQPAPDGNSPTTQPTGNGG